MNKFISAKATRILFMLFVMFVVSGTTAFAQELPKIAVYATGDVGSNEKSALGTRMLSSLIRSGRYRAIERSSAFLAELDNELVRQHSGAIDDSQISALGKQYGVDFICIADITPAFGEFQVSARIINVETAEVVFIGDASGQLRTMSDLEQISSRVLSSMFGESVIPSSIPVETHSSQTHPTSSTMIVEPSSPSQSLPTSSTMIEDFTVGERWATFGLNLVLPGGGHAIIMKDWTGAIVAWSISGVFAITTATGVTEQNVFPDGLGILLGAVGGNAVYGSIWNVIRSTTYHRPGSPKSKRPARQQASASIITRDAFNFAAFPDRNGNWQASALYVAEF